MQWEDKEIAPYLLLLFTGLLAGFLAGLLGIGGGVIMVPLLFYLFPTIGFPHEVAVHMALGTSLAAATFLSLSSSLAHIKKGHFHKEGFPFVAAGGLLGALIGSTIATHVNGLIMKKAFALLLFYAAARIGLNVGVKPNQEDNLSTPKPVVLFPVGVMVGSIASFFGIGGGVVAVPLMVIVLKFPMTMAVGTSASLIPFITGTGALGYILFGTTSGHLFPAHSLGYVHLPSWICLVLGGTLGAQVGARLTAKVKVEVLRRAFAVLLLFTAVKIILK